MVLGDPGRFFFGATTKLKPQIEKAVGVEWHSWGRIGQRAVCMKPEGVSVLGD